MKDTPKNPHEKAVEQRRAELLKLGVALMRSFSPDRPPPSPTFPLTALALGIAIGGVLARQTGLDEKLSMAMLATAMGKCETEEEMLAVVWPKPAKEKPVCPPFSQN